MKSVKKCYNKSLAREMIDPGRNALCLKTGRMFKLENDDQGLLVIHFRRLLPHSD
jgi:hypothetical protein